MILETDILILILSWSLYIQGQGFMDYGHPKGKLLIIVFSVKSYKDSPGCRIGPRPAWL